MKKKALIGMAFLMVTMLLVGCGGVSQEEYDAAVADKDAAEAQVSSLQSQLSAAQSDLSAAEADLATAEADLAAAQSDLSAAQSSLTSSKAQVTTLTAQVADLEAQIADLEAQIAALEAPAEEEEEEEAEEEEEETGGFTGTTYTDSTYGISFTYPDTWADKTEGLTAGLTKQFGVSATYYVPAVYYLTPDESTGATLEDAFKAFLDGAGYGFSSFTGSSVTIDGVECTKADVVYVHSYGDISGTWVGFVKDGKWVIVGVIEFPALGGSFENATQKDDIVNSITISS